MTGNIETIIWAASFPLMGVIISVLPSLINSAKIKIENKKLKKSVCLLTKKVEYFTDFSLEEDGIYYNKNNLPFCPACFAKGHKVPLQKRVGEPYFDYNCPACPALYAPKHIKKK